MPIYEYGCNGCKAKFEFLIMDEDEDIPECPRCTGDDLQKLISVSDFHLKGDGWFKKTDSKRRSVPSSKWDCVDSQGKPC